MPAPPPPAVHDGIFRISLCRQVAVPAPVAPVDGSMPPALRLRRPVVVPVRRLEDRGEMRMGAALDHPAGPVGVDPRRSS